MVTTYDVVLAPDSTGSWVARIPEVRGCHTYGRTLAQARQRIRLALALWRDDAADAAFAFRIELPDETQAAVSDFQKLRDESQRAAAKAQEALREAISTLVEDEFLSTRDVAEVLNLSHQQVARRMNTDRAPA